MNIFASDDDPVIAAKSLDDKRIVKMVLETAQMLSAVAHRYSAKGQWYKLTHAKHPCTLWAGDTDGNLSWLLLHGDHLGAEYTKRFGKTHKSHSVITDGYALLKHMPKGPRLPFANCTPYKDMPVTEAYRRYLSDKWQADIRPPKWTSAEPPSWFIPPTKT